MRSILPPIGGGKGERSSARTIEDFNRYLHDEIRKKKGLPLDYERGKDKDYDETERTEDRSNR